jgi:hypothetical protein
MFSTTKTWFYRTLESERVLSLISREVAGRKEYYNIDVFGHRRSRRALA